jgi:multisubunit Na+/H+ antiporter MnhB subunit
VTVARNVAIIALLAAAVAFVPGGGTTANIVGGVLSTLILVAFVLLAARFYRERRLDLDSLGDRWRGALYGAIAVLVLAFAGRARLWETGGGTLLWIIVVAGACYLLYLVWRRHREYA